MDTRQLATRIVELVGDAGNVQACAHCYTRLRFTLKDNDKAQMDELKALDGVLDVQQVGAQTQVIIGPGVNKVYDAVADVIGTTGSGSESDDGAPAEKAGLVSQLMDTVTGIFGPIIATLVAGGMTKAIMAICVLFGLSKTSQEYVIFNFIADAPFYFLPISIAFSSAKKFGANPYLALIVMGALIHPNFAALVTKGDPLSFFGIPVMLVSYSSSVLPAILITWFMAYVQRFAEKIAPEFIKAILVPMLTVLVTAPVGLLLIGPIGTFLGQGLAAIMNVLDSYAPFLVPTAMGAFTPLLVFVGMHNTLLPVATVQLSTQGYETVFGPGMLASNIAQGAASLAVGLKLKDEKAKQLALSASATALCGITEPALYGVTFRRKRVLVSVMVGGGIAGLFAGLTGLVRYAFGSPGLPTLPVFIGENPMNIVLALSTVAISFVTTFLLTWFFGMRGEDSAPKLAERVEGQNTDVALETVTVASPLDGKVIALSDVADKTFASGVIGRGAAVVPADGTIYAPVDGTVIAVFETKHAIGLMGADGEEVLIHLGIDTVELGGKGFDIKVAQGDEVHVGQVLGTMDLEAVRAAGYDVTTPVIVTNSNEFADVVGAKPGEVSHGGALIDIFKEVR